LELLIYSLVRAAVIPTLLSGRPAKKAVYALFGPSTRVFPPGIYGRFILIALHAKPFD
jgi:hypothetical protein